MLKREMLNNYHKITWVLVLILIQESLVLLIIKIKVVKIKINLFEVYYV
jgi:hypothetical protein